MGWLITPAVLQSIEYFLTVVDGVMLICAVLSFIIELKSKLTTTQLKLITYMLPRY